MAKYRKIRPPKELAKTMQFYWILSLLFALIVALFAIQNAEAVDIRFLTWQFKDISLVLVILGSAVAGAVILFIVGAMKQVKMAWKIREAEGKIRKLEIELTKLVEEKEHDGSKLKLLETELENLKNSPTDGTGEKEAADKKEAQTC